MVISVFIPYSEEKHLKDIIVVSVVKFLGSSKVSVGNRITLSVDVVKEVKIKSGDHVIFEKDDKGNIIIRKG